MKWTEEETKILMDNYSKMTCKQLSGLIKRGYSAIYCKARCLGLRKNKKYSVKVLSLYESIYFAGFFDGDGSIGLYSGIPVLGISITDEKFALYISKLIGSSIRKNRNNYGREFFQLRVTSRKFVGSVLRQILPYLVYKKKQAEIMLRFLSSTLSSDEAEELLKLEKHKD